MHHSCSKFTRKINNIEDTMSSELASLTCKASTVPFGQLAVGNQHLKLLFMLHPICVVNQR